MRLTLIVIAVALAISFLEKWTGKTLGEWFQRKP